MAIISLTDEQADLIIDLLGSRKDFLEIRMRDVTFSPTENRRLREQLDLTKAALFEVQHKQDEFRGYPPDPHTEQRNAPAEPCTHPTAYDDGMCPLCGTYPVPNSKKREVR